MPFCSRFNSSNYELFTVFCYLRILFGGLLSKDISYHHYNIFSHGFWRFVTYVKKCKPIFKCSKYLYSEGFACLSQAWYNLIMLPREYRLKKRTAFNATYKTGKSFYKGGITLFCGKCKSEEQKEFTTKIGFVVSKKIHKRAVKRNRIKRLMRESVRLYIKNCGKVFDSRYLSLIFVASSKLLGKDFEYVSKQINELTEKTYD